MIRPNLSNDEKVALKDLSKRADVINTNADKGGAVVIMYLNNYIRHAKCKLNDSKNYSVFAKDPATTNNNFVSQAIDRFTKQH